MAPGGVRARASCWFSSEPITRFMNLRIEDLQLQPKGS